MGETEMVRRVARAMEAVGADMEFEDYARAAIEAMREPTDKMYEAAKGDFGGVGALKMSRAIWTAMIDAAL